MTYVAARYLDNRSLITPCTMQDQAEIITGSSRRLV